METKDVKQVTKLGAFVAGGVILFLGSLFYLGREGNLFNKTFIISAIFKNVEGLKEGDNVWLSGVKIGTVKRVQIVSEGQVIVDLSLKDKQNEFIKRDATAFVGSDGLVGNKIVIIRPGAAHQTIQDNDTINALSPADTQELINIAKEVGVNTRAITDDLKIISARLNKGEGILGELLHEGAISIELRQTIAALKETSENSNRIAIETRTLLHLITNGQGLVAQLISDTAYAHSFGTTLQNINATSVSARKVTNDLQQVTAQMKTVDNAWAVLLSDTVFAQHLQETMIHTNSASLKLDENMEALRHNFLFRRYFRKKKKEETKDEN
jgi:phospholipid/cholesterol/gamma-HCH transport system substrate-binding protein